MKKITNLYTKELLKNMTLKNWLQKKTELKANLKTKEQFS